MTVIEAGGNTALQVKTEENDGYSAVQVGFDTQKEQRVTKPLLGHFKKAGSEPKKLIREFRLAGWHHARRRDRSQREASSPPAMWSMSSARSRAKASRVS